MINVFENIMIMEQIKYINNFIIKLFTKNDSKQIIQNNSSDLIELLEVQNLYDKFNLFISTISKNLHVTRIILEEKLEISLGYVKEFDLTSEDVHVEIMNNYYDEKFKYGEYIAIKDLNINDLQKIVNYVNKCSIKTTSGIECYIFQSRLPEPCKIRFY